MSATQQTLLMMGGGTPLAVSIYGKIVAWWELDETSGTTVNDAHTNALHGTSSGMTVNASGLAANIGTSYTAPSGNHYINIPHNAALSIDGPLSLMVWVKRNGAQAAFPKLLWKPGTTPLSGQANYLLYYNASTGAVGFTTTSGGVNRTLLSGAFTLSDATVYQIIATHTDAVRNIYFNGSNVGSNSTPLTGALNTTTNDLRKGYNGDANDPWVGSHDQSAVFNGELSATEVTYLYNGGAGISYAVLKAAAGF